MLINERLAGDLGFTMIINCKYSVSHNLPAIMFNVDLMACEEVQVLKAFLVNGAKMT